MSEAYTLVEHAALGPLNTFGVAATARWLAEVRDARRRESIALSLDAPVRGDDTGGGGWLGGGDLAVSNQDAKGEKAAEEFFAGAGALFRGGLGLAIRAHHRMDLRGMMAGMGDQHAVDGVEGQVRIGGETLLSTFHIGNPGVNGMNNQQGTVRYTLDGMTTYGMIERSSPSDLCQLVD